VWALPAAAAAAVAFSVSRAMRAAAASRAQMATAAWSGGLALILLANLSEPGNALHAVWLRLTPLAACERALADGWAGLLGSTSFSANRAVRYAVFRMISYVMDAPRARAAGDRASWPEVAAEAQRFVAYIYYAPLYLCGPVMTYEQFYDAEQDGGGGDAEAHAALLQLGWPLLALASFLIASQTVYYPAALLRPSMVVGGGATGGLPAGVADYFVVCFGFLTATWLSSALVFAVPRLAARAGGVRAPHDTPTFWAGAARSATHFWANFHVSLFAFFAKYVYGPLGGGGGALTAVVALSWYIHGFHAHWAAWGLLNWFALLCERRLARVKGVWARGALVRAANRSAVISIMLALAVGGELPRGVLSRVVGLGFCLALLHERCTLSPSPW
jgi:hypothetical protein